jgi:pSer/pThr/pTyr-binding forkhead associated (FHA) protein
MEGVTASITRLIAKDAAIFRQSGRGRFIVIRGPDRGESLVVGPSPITLGSGSASDVRLSDPTISRRHLSVTLAESGVVVRDLGSTNGSFVGGARFQELLLGFGAEIQIGQTLLKYLPDEEHVDVAPAASERFGNMLGRDPKMRQVFSLLEDVAHSEATVLLEGETGTGKELLAEEIHRHSPRADKPFVVFDCAAQPKDLIESALFGHVRGAFTGAIADRKGAFVEADGGTLFLDEIGELAWKCSPCSCARSTSAPSGRWAAPGNAWFRCAWSRPPIATCAPRWRPSAFAKISTIGWRWFASTCRPCASARPMSPAGAAFRRELRQATGTCGCGRRTSNSWRACPGRATSGNCAM